MTPSVDAWLVAPTVALDESCLSGADRRRADDMLSAAASGRHRRSRAAVRHVAADRLALRPEEVRVVDRPGAPPRLAGDDAPHLALAHAGDHVLVGLRADGPVGIDVEVVGRRHRPVPAVVLTTERLAAVARHVPADTAPLVVWVVLEAALKAAGTGFAFPQREAVVRPVHDGIAVTLGHLGTFGVGIHRPAGDVVAAVAVPATVPAVHWHSIVVTRGPQDCSDRVTAT